MSDNEIIVSHIIKFVMDTLKKYTKTILEYFKSYTNRTFIVVASNGTVRSIVVNKNVLKNKYDIPSDAEAGEFFLVVNNDGNHIYYITEYHTHEEVKEFNITEYNNLKSKVDDMEKLLMDLIDKGD